LTVPTLMESVGLGPLTQAQARFMNAPHPSRLFLGGIGSGKTAVGLLACLTEALDPSGINRGLPVGIFAPTFRQSKRIHVARVLDMLNHWERIHGWSLLRRFHRSDFIMELRGGAELWFLSYSKDVDRLRGLELCAAYVDEIEQVPDPASVWGLIGGRVRIGTARKWASTTPKGYRGVPRLFLDNLRNDPDAGLHHMVVSRSTDNPYLSPQFIKDCRQNMSRRAFRAEIECSLLRSADVVFPEFRKEQHPIGHLIRYRHQPGTQWWLSCDWGYSHASFLCWARIKTPTGDVDVCFKELHPDDTPVDRQRTMIRNLARDLGREPQACYVDRADPRQNRWLMTEFPSAQVTWMHTRGQQSQWNGVETFRALLDPMGEDLQVDKLNPPKLAIADHLVRCESERGIIRSLENLRRRIVNNELTDEILKDNVHDHSVDSALYFAKGRHGMPGGFSV